jgi:small subunit ribosomal protein S16
MSVVIRLMRAGAKKRPFYRVVAADSRRQRDGRFLEILGHYNPLTRPYELVLHKDRVEEWLTKGAQPSEQAASLLRSLGIPMGTPSKSTKKVEAGTVDKKPRKRVVARQASPRKVRAKATRKAAKKKAAAKVA